MMNVYFSKKSERDACCCRYRVVMQANDAMTGLISFITYHVSDMEIQCGYESYSHNKAKEALSTLVFESMCRYSEHITVRPDLEYMFDLVMEGYEFNRQSWVESHPVITPRYIYEDN